MAIIMHSISASEFKAKCLKIMDEVNQTGEEVIITKNGLPVSKLTPFQKKPASLYGLDKDLLEIKGDIIAPIETQWDALK